MSSKRLNNFIKYIAIFSNIAFITWIIYNGISQLFATSTAQFFCSAGVVGMLGINIVLLIAKR
jgi:hypothetical protein